MCRPMALAPAAMLLWTCACPACLRPQIDERAVQWSTAIVQARLLAEGQPVTLGKLQERQGARGALGVATTTYFYRQYDFQVTSSMDGPYKAGDHIPVLRIWMNVQNPPGFCQQHLAKSSIGKEFLLLLRPFAQFELIWPNVVKKPQVNGAMIVIHLEPKADLKPDALADLGTAIVEARSDAKQATPQKIHTQITAAESAPDDAKAKPALDALARMGPRIIPDVQQAANKATGPGQARLLQLMVDLTPPDPVMKAPDDSREGR